MPIYTRATQPQKVIQSCIIYDSANNRVSPCSVDWVVPFVLAG